jgi:hypothetical protein
VKNIFFYVLAIATISEIVMALWFLGHKNTKPLQKTAFPFLVFLLFLGAIFVFRLPVPFYVLLLVLLTVFLNAFMGHFLNLYNRTVWFDRTLHAVGTFSNALLLYFTLIGVFTPGGSAAFNAVVIFSLGVAGGAVIEIIEFAVDRKTGSMNQRGLKDTNVDIIFNVIGALAAAVFAFFGFLWR